MYYIVKIFLYLFIFIVICLVAFLQMIKISPPEIKDKRSINLVRKNISKDFYTINQNWIKKMQTIQNAENVTKNKFSLDFTKGNLSTIKIEILTKNISGNNIG